MWIVYQLACLATLVSLAAGGEQQGSLSIMTPEQETQHVMGHLQRRRLAAMSGDHKPLRQFVPLRQRKLSMAYPGECKPLFL